MCTCGDGCPKVVISIGGRDYEATSSKKKPGWVLTDRYVGGFISATCVKGEEVGESWYELPACEVQEGLKT